MTRLGWLGFSDSREDGSLVVTVVELEASPVSSTLVCGILGSAKI